MKNWMQRLTLFAVVGAILSSAVLVGCGGADEEEDAGNATNNAAAKGADAGDE